MKRFFLGVTFIFICFSLLTAFASCRPFEVSGSINSVRIMHLGKAINDDKLTVNRSSGTLVLTAEVMKTGDISDAVSFTSSNKSVATVSGGVITLKVAGITSITATANADTRKKHTINLTVFEDEPDIPDPGDDNGIVSVSILYQGNPIPENKLTVHISQNPLILTAVAVTYGNISDEVAFTSSAPAVAAVENAEIKLLNTGTALITAVSVADNTKKDSFMLTVIENDLLKTAYNDYFPVGAALSEWSAGLFTKLLPHYSSMTCESEMKWEYVHPSINTYTFASADNLVNIAKSHNMLIRGHTLIWYRSLPAWVLQGATKQTALERMRSHINTVVKHFGTDVYCWDVVNEAIKTHVSDQQLASGDIYRTGGEASGGDWYAVCGKDYIKEAFIAARQAADEIGAYGMKLFYNDFDMDNANKRDAVLMMCKELNAEGVPIDGVGFQAHYNVGGFLASELEESIKAFTEIGLDVQLTEIDISIYPWGPESERYTTLPESLEIAQAAIFGKMFEVMRKYSQPWDEGYGRVTGATFWGVGDQATWLDNDPVPGRKNWPHVFDVNQKPKLAYDAIVNVHLPVTGPSLWQGWGYVIGGNEDETDVSWKNLAGNSYLSIAMALDVPENAESFSITIKNTSDKTIPLRADFTYGASTIQKTDNIPAGGSLIISVGTESGGKLNALRLFINSATYNDSSVHSGSVIIYKPVY